MLPCVWRLFFGGGGAFVPRSEPPTTANRNCTEIPLTRVGMACNVCCLTLNLMALLAGRATGSSQWFFYSGLKFPKFPVKVTRQRQVTPLEHKQPALGSKQSLTMPQFCKNWTPPGHRFWVQIHPLCEGEPALVQVKGCLGVDLGYRWLLSSSIVYAL